MNVAAFLHRAARLWPERPALALGTRTTASYRAFARQAVSLAHHLRARLGLTAGDRAAIVMTNCPDYMVVKYALWQAGLCAVPANAWRLAPGGVSDPPRRALSGPIAPFVTRMQVFVTPVNLQSTPGVLASQHVSRVEDPSPRFGPGRAGVERTGRAIQNWRCASTSVSEVGLRSTQ